MPETTRRCDLVGFEAWHARKGGMRVLAASPEGAAEELAAMLDLRHLALTPVQRIEVRLDPETVRTYRVVGVRKGGRPVYRATDVTGDGDA